MHTYLTTTLRCVFSVAIWAGSACAGGARIDGEVNSRAMLVATAPARCINTWLSTARAGQGGERRGRDVRLQKLMGGPIINSSPVS